jgi:hydroxymethylglutaryl-CoA reductase
MRLHARNIATLAGARGNLIKIVAQRIADENKVDIKRAKEIIALMSEKSPNINDHYIDNNK